MCVSRCLIKTLVRSFSIIGFAICLSVLAASSASAFGGELYSETTYVPQYGLLTDTQLRLLFLEKNPVTLYIGGAIQRQDKTTTSQDDLYSENLNMALVGGRVKIWKSLTAFFELRTEERSRGGVYAGNIWEYLIFEKNFFSEFYGEAIVLPSFHNDPVTTFWFKQGLRFQPVTHFYLDPYLEIYLRRSPTPDLGRDTDQARVGLRALYAWERWTAGLLIYESWPTDEAPHEEALFFLGGSF